MNLLKLALASAALLSAGSAHATLFEISFIGTPLPGYTLPLDPSVNYYEQDGVSLNFYVDDETPGSTYTQSVVLNGYGGGFIDPSFWTTATLSGSGSSTPIKAITLSGDGNEYFLSTTKSSYLSKSNFTFVLCPSGSAGFCEASGPGDPYAVGYISVTAQTQYGSVEAYGGLYAAPFPSDALSGPTMSRIYEGYWAENFAFPNAQADIFYYAVKVSEVSAIPSAVPEPASWVLMIGGIGVAGGMIRRKRDVSVSKVSFA